MEKLTPDFLRSLGFYKTKSEPMHDLEVFECNAGKARIQVNVTDNTFFGVRASRDDLHFEWFNKETTQDKFCEMIKLVLDLDLKKLNENG